MIIVVAPASISNIMRMKLPHSGMKIDSRLIGNHQIADRATFEYDRLGWTFNCDVEDFTLTITRTDRNTGWPWQLKFRGYNPAEESVPDFLSDYYMYMGIEGEHAPKDIINLAVHPSVKIIRQFAFRGCSKMKTCTMGNGVEKIEMGAFMGCSSMERVKISNGLVTIGKQAFWECKSLDAIFLPSTLQQIEDEAFRDCISMRILVLPPKINLDRVGERIVRGCETLLKTGAEMDIQYKWQQLFFNRHASNNDEVNRWVANRLDGSPLYQICADASVKSSTIHAYIQEYGTSNAYVSDFHGLAPLHIVTMNPHASMSAIVACFSANRDFLCAKDGNGLTPLDYLWKGSNVEGLVALIQILCIESLSVGKSNRKKASFCTLTTNNRFFKYYYKNNSF